MNPEQTRLTDLLVSDSNAPYSVVDNIYHLCKDSLKTYKHMSPLDIVTVIYQITEKIDSCVKKEDPEEIPSLVKEINCLVFELASRQFRAS